MSLIRDDDPADMVAAITLAFLAIGLVLLAFGRPAAGAQQLPERYVMARGPVAATAQEQTSCTFRVGPTTRLEFHAGGIDCLRARTSLVGRSIRLIAEVEPGQ